MPRKSRHVTGTRTLRVGQLCSELAKTGVTIYKLRRFVKAREASNAVNGKVNVEKELDKRLCAGLTTANLKDLFVLAWKHATRKGKVELAHKMCEIAYGIGFNDSAEQEDEPGDSEAAQDGNSQSAGGSNPPQGPEEVAISTLSGMGSGVDNNPGVDGATGQASEDHASASISRRGRSLERSTEVVHRANSSQPGHGPIVSSLASQTQSSLSVPATARYPTMKALIDARNTYTRPVRPRPGRGRASLSHPTSFTTPIAHREQFRKARSLGQVVNAQVSPVYDPADLTKRRDCGRPKYIPSRLQVCDMPHLCYELQSQLRLRCPDCDEGRCVWSVKGVGHSCVVKVSCENAATLVTFTEKAEEDYRKGSITAEELSSHIAAKQAELGCCTFMKKLVGSRQLMNNVPGSFSLFYNVGPRSYLPNCSTLADYCCVIQSQLAFDTYWQYEQRSRSVVKQKPRGRNTFYGVGKRLFKDEVVEPIWQKQQSVIMRIVQFLTEQNRTMDTSLGLDTTYTTRRNAQACITLLMSCKLKLVYEAEIVIRKDEPDNTTANQLEPIGTERVLDKLFAFLEGKDPDKDWFPRHIALDEHPANNRFVEKKVFDLLKAPQYSYSAKLVGPTECGNSREICVRGHIERSSSICGKHAEEILFLDGMYKVEKGGGTIVEVSRECILDLVLNGNELPEPGCSVRVLNKAGYRMYVVLDMWHKEKSLSKILDMVLGRIKSSESLPIIKAEIIGRMRESFRLIMTEERSALLCSWLSSGVQLGSVAVPDNDASDVLEEQPIPHSGIAAVERWMVGEDILFARHIDKSRLQFECDCVECECYKDGIEALFEELKSSSVCSCGRLNVDNFDAAAWSPEDTYEEKIEKLKKQKKSGKSKGSYVFLDLHKAGKLGFEDAMSSICESCNSFLHKHLLKFRWFRDTLKGRVLYLLLMWNAMELSAVLGFIDKRGRVKERRH